MSAYYELIYIIIQQFYLPLLNGLELIPLMNVEVLVGVELVTLGVITASVITSIITFAFIYMPLHLLYKGFKRVTRLW